MAVIAKWRILGGSVGAAVSVLLTGVAPARIATPPRTNFARFDWVEMRSSEPTPAVSTGQFRNPILAGFYPDPSIIKVGADFYMVNSTFSWFPGIPVWHSRDLVHWRQIGNAIQRPGQLDFTGLRMAGGVFAPSISYHRGRFYIVNTCVGCGGNFVITASNPAGPWSQPVWLKNVDGIDPSLFIDDDGSAWLLNNDLPEGGERYPGHRAIKIRRFELETLQAPGAGAIIVDGGAEPAAKPVWIEGPHLFRKDGVYYLLAAEGGTDDKHSEVVFLADHIEGPYRAAPPSINPILTQRDAGGSSVTSTGHAQFVELDDGKWWSVFLGTRPYGPNLYNTGRETFLAPVDWRSGWPVIVPHGAKVPLVAPAPALVPFAATPTTGSFTRRDDFSTSTLALSWMTMRTPSERWWRIEHGGLLLPARNARLGDGRQPSFLGQRQPSANTTVTAKLAFHPGEGEEAGLAAVQNDAYFLTIGLARVGARTVVKVSRRASAADPVEGVTVATAAVPAGQITARLRSRGARYDFDYSLAPGRWIALAHNVDGTNLSSAVAGGFVGTLIGPYAQTRQIALPLPATEETYHLGQTVDGAKP